MTDSGRAEPEHNVTPHVDVAPEAQPVTAVANIDLPEIETPPTNAERAKKLRRARVRRWYVMQIPYFLVLFVVLVAGILVFVDRWRRGAFVFGGALAFGAVLRAFLPTSRAGLLQVRSRGFDVAALATLATVVLWMATTIDPLGTR